MILMMTGTWQERLESLEVVTLPYYTLNSARHSISPQVHSETVWSFLSQGRDV